jgi:hypothetical protein
VAARGVIAVLEMRVTSQREKSVRANIETAGASSRFDMKCPIEPLKMTPVSPYNTACDEAPEKEGS